MTSKRQAALSNEMQSRGIDYGQTIARLAIEQFPDGFDGRGWRRNAENRQTAITSALDKLAVWRREEVPTPRRPVQKSLKSPEYAGIIALLVAVRKRAGIHQQPLSKKLGRPQSFIAKYEGGERRLDVIEFIEIARALIPSSCSGISWQGFSKE